MWLEWWECLVQMFVYWLTTFIPHSFAQHGVELLHVVEVGLCLVACVRIGVIQPRFHKLHYLVFLFFHPPHELAIWDCPVVHHELELSMTAHSHIRVFTRWTVNETTKPLRILMYSKQFFYTCFCWFGYSSICTGKLFY